MASELLERDLYNGHVNLVHNPKARGSQPRYVATIDGVVTKPQGATTILGNTLSKDLMQWAVDCCTKFLHEKVEDGITADDIDEAAQQYIQKRESGAGTGTEAHALVEHFLKGLDDGKHVVAMAPPDASPEARRAFEAFVKWFKQAKPTVVNVEEIIYSLAYSYAGAYDCMLEIDGKVYLCDLKTTNASRKAPNGVYAEYFAQLGAYANAYEEQREYEALNGGTKLVKIDDLMVISAKKDGKLDIVTASDVGLSVEECMERFLDVVSLNKFLKETTKVLGGR